MPDIAFKEFNDRRQGVVVGQHVKVEGSTDKVAGAVGGKKLVGGGRSGPFDVVNQAVNIHGFMVNPYFVNGAGFRDVLHHQLVGIFSVCAEVIVNGFITHVKAAFIGRKVDVDPVGFATGMGITGDFRVNRDFKSIGIDAVEQAVFPLGEVDAEVAPGLGDRRVAAGGHHGCEQYRNQQLKGYSGFMHRAVLWF